MLKLTICALILLGCLTQAEGRGSIINRKGNVVTSSDRSKKWEVFGFYTGHGEWKKFDWSILTTIVIFNSDDLENSSDLLLKAYENDVTVVIKTAPSADCVVDEGCRLSTVSEVWSLIKDYSLGGVNVDVEFAAPLPLNSTLQMYLNMFMSDLREMIGPDRQLTFDAPWSPECIDGRCYDFKAIDSYVDFTFIMAYDMQSQMGDPPCIANANSPIDMVEQGIQKYLSMNISGEKLVLGLPWYGYDYQCLPSNTPDTADSCEIKQVPFRGSTCSDAAGRQYGVGDLLTRHPDLLTSSHFDSDTCSMRYDYIDSTDGTRHQVWYDNPDTLTPKNALAGKMGLRGVGMWNLDLLFYGTDNRPDETFTQQMWETLKQPNQ